MAADSNAPGVNTSSDDSSGRSRSQEGKPQKEGRRGRRRPRRRSRNGESNGSRDRNNSERGSNDGPRRPRSRPGRRRRPRRRSDGAGSSSQDAQTSLAVLEQREPFDEALESELDETSFGEFGLARALLKAIRRAGYEHPRQIQERTLPAAMEGRDVLGLAQTGTGKTAAFVLPILHRLVKEPRRAHRALILAPTRELAIQIETEVHTLAHYTQIGAVSIYGGVSEKPQLQRLSKGPEVLVACPGRLLDFIRQDIIDLSTIQVLVLDEADHMFDMGFLEDVRKIIAALPERRQNLMFAATMPKEIRDLAQFVLDRPYEVELSHTTPAETIEHALYPVVEQRKFDLLEHFLSSEDFQSAIIFTRTKYRAKRIAHKLDRMGHKAVALQGNMSQSQRDRAMQGFRRGDYDVLVATDIVARGIDVDQVSHVINFDVPNTAEAYTHRIGRTGRSERDGKAYTFVTEDDGDIVRSIERKIGEKLEISDEVILEDMVLPVPGSKSRSKRSRESSRGSQERRGRRRRGGAPGEERDRSRGRRRRRVEDADELYPQDSSPGASRDDGGERGDSAEGDGSRRARRRRPRRRRRERDDHRERRPGDDSQEGQRDHGAAADRDAPADRERASKRRRRRRGERGDNSDDRSRRESSSGDSKDRKKRSRRERPSRKRDGSRGGRGTPDGIELEIEPKRRRPPPRHRDDHRDGVVPDGVDFEP